LKRFFLLILLGGWIAFSINSCRNHSIQQPISQRPGCVQNYNPNQDYFPEKTQIQYAQGFQVKYHKHYKVITVNNPWRDANRSFQYVLVQCGTPVPSGFEQSQVVQVPIQRIAVLSTTHLGHLESLQLLDRLVAVSNIKLVYSQEVHQYLQKNNVQEIGSNTNLNIEKIIDISPDLITTYGTGNLQQDAHPQLLEAGLKVAINSEYMESTPLGHAEWIKFTALFFNQEQAVNQQFNQIVREYKSVAAIAQKAQNKPTVITGFHRNGTWNIPGGNSYVAKLLKDAGANYFGADNAESGSIPLSFEAVYDRALNAQVWLNGSQDWTRLQDVASTDERYTKLSAFKSGRVFNNNARVNEFGGNDYWQSGTISPHLVLSDLVKILHPELLPEHQLIYYQPLK